MTRPLFVTGAGGFLGSRLLPRLAGGRGEIRCLTRDAARAAGSAPSGVRWIEGDLREPDRYAAALDGVEAIFHLAAATGAATAAEHDAVNLRGTIALLERAPAAGTGRFVFVSSIAAKFARLDRYPYGRSKAAAEDAVRAAGLPFTILRPTLLLGPGSPGLAGLARLALLPVVPLLGGGSGRVQPLDVEDAARLVAAAVHEGGLLGETVELGGPEGLSVAALLRAIRRTVRGSEGLAVPLPLAPLRLLLTALEATGFRPPVTAGQLASFVEDGTASPHPFTDRHRAGLAPLDASLRRSLAPEARE